MDQVSFGQRLRQCRKEKGFSQEEVSERIGVSAQAISKWEKGEVLPDLFHFQILAKFFHVSADSLLEIEPEDAEHVIETIKVGGAVFEVVKKPETILAGKIFYAKDYPSIGDFYTAIDSVDFNQRTLVSQKIVAAKLPAYDITLSVNFWLDEASRAMGFVRETSEEQQPEGIDVFKMPASLFIRGYTDRGTAGLLAKESCEPWEMFAYIRNYILLTYRYKMAENGAQEMEVFDVSGHSTGYAYVPVEKL